MSPCHIENTIKAACGLIGAMMTVGEARPYITALLVLNAEAASVYAARECLADASPQALATHPDVIAQIATGIAQGNAKLSRVEQIRRLRCYRYSGSPAGTKSPLTMKLKRKPVTQKYAADIAELYAAEPGSPCTSPLSHAASDSARRSFLTNTLVHRPCAVGSQVRPPSASPYLAGSATTGRRSPSLTVTCCAPGDALFVGDVISVQAAPSQCLRSARGVTPDSHRTARAAE